MANEVRIRATVDDKVSGALGRIHDKFDNLGKSQGFKSLVQGFGVGVGIGIYDQLGRAAGMAADFIGDSIEASRDLGETLSKSKVVFGDAASDVERFGDTAATSLGISKQAAIEAAATFGNFFVGLGQGEGDAARMSKRLVTLAGDLASFNNMDPTETLDKLRAGLAGEAEPLRRVGVFLSAAKVQAKAMEMGLGDAHRELTEGEKVLARYQLILDETGTAQGDFARTSESLANKQRTAAAMLIDKQAELGKAFEPIALQTTEWQIDFIYGLGVAGDAVDDFLDMLTPWDTWMTKAEERARSMSLHSTDAIEDLRVKSTADLGKVQAETDKTGDEFAEMGGDARRSARVAKTSFADMVSSLIGSTEELIGQVFDPIETRADLYQERLSQNAAEEAYRDAETARAKREATDDIMSSIRRQADGLVDLGKQGKLTKKDVDTFERNVKKSYEVLGKEVPADIRKIIAQLRNLDKWDGHKVNVSVNVTGDSMPGRNSSVRGGSGRATGGPVNANEVYMVGEQGPELFVSDKAGTIVPNHRLGRGGVGPLGLSSDAVTVNVNVISAGVLSPGHGNAIARELGPFLRDYLARRG